MKHLGSITQFVAASAMFCIGVAIIYGFDKDEADEIPFAKEVQMADPELVQGNAPCLKLYNAINKYAAKYDIPHRYAFGIARKETGYRGPFHWNYNPGQISPVGAVGPMQVMPSTGNSIWKKQVPIEKLMNDISFNVETSMMLLRKLYDKYGDWKTVFGAYNTGKPCVNGYAIDVYNYNYDFIEL